MTHSCKHCKQNFAASRLNQYYCSQSCRQKAYLVRNGSAPVSNKPPPPNEIPSQLKGILDNFIKNPAMLHDLLLSVNNPSMTDSASKNAVTPVTPAKNDPFSFNHPKSVNTVSENIEEPLRTTKNHQNTITNPSKQDDVFTKMIREQLTILIGVKGFIRERFKYWSEKEWLFALHVNEELVSVLETIYSMSFERYIEVKMLKSIHEKLKQLSTGIYSALLPIDYPFMNFIRHVKSRIDPIMSQLSDKKVIPFRLSDELKEQIGVICVQAKV